MSRLHLLHCAELSRDGKRMGRESFPRDEDEPDGDLPEKTSGEGVRVVDLASPGRVSEETSLPTVSRDQVVYRLFSATSPR